MPRRGAELHAIADDCSQSERRAADAERELVEWKKVKFMAGPRGRGVRRPDHQHRRSTASSWSWTDLFIEGLVPIDTLPGDQYTYQENVRKIVGKRTRREFSIGDKVRVVLDRVDADERKLQFSIVEPQRKKRK